MSSQHPSESSITPEGVSTFEHVARRLHLSPEKYANSRELKEWVRKNKDHKYVPLYLLELWGLEVNLDIAAGMKKPPNTPPKPTVPKIRGITLASASGHLLH